MLVTLVVAVLLTSLEGLWLGLLAVALAIVSAYSVRALIQGTREAKLQQSFVFGFGLVPVLVFAVWGAFRLIGSA
ncbi:MAG: hypothetical protein E6J42_08760 [Chloroflexi bacterium]|nr:MAG: hypothetical protein E6J42_08760 [Chloroflexota bacterium]